ncbi:MAG: hypothetical protein ACXU9U_05510 [Parachlamydiaceae bacterium]
MKKIFNISLFAFLIGTFGFFLINAEPENDDSEIAYGDYDGYEYSDPESQPGMSDDSSAVYESYLRANAVQRSPRNFPPPSAQAKAYAEGAYLVEGEEYYRPSYEGQYYSPYPNVEPYRR